MSTACKSNDAWLTCAQKTCCRTYLVHLHGRDCARIAHRLGVFPPQFSMAVRNDDAGDGFALDKSAARYRIALRHVAAAKGTRCSFLFETPDGAARCGLGTSRPEPCLRFPVEWHGDRMVVDAGACTCAGFAAVSFDGAHERREWERESAHWQAYEAVVQRWNVFVALAEDTAPYTYDDYCRYLLDAYAT